MSTTDELEAARAELNDLRATIREQDTPATAAQSRRVDELLDELESLEAPQAGPDFTEEELEKIDAWARTPGVQMSSLPLEFRAAVEHRRDELADQAVDEPGPDGQPVTGENAGEDLTEDEAAAIVFERDHARATECRLTAAGRALATYHDRRRRLAALEVRDTQAARQAKLELELGEALEALEAIEAVLETGA